MSNSGNKYLTQMKSTLNGVDFSRPRERRLAGEIAITAAKLKDSSRLDMPVKLENLLKLIAELSKSLEQPPCCPTCGHEVAKP